MSPDGYDLVAADRSALFEAAPLSAEKLRIVRIFDGDRLRLVRLTLAAGQVMRDHSTNSSLVIHVIAGTVLLRVAGDELTLPDGAVLHIRPGERHEVEALQDAHLLLTMAH